MRRLGFAAACVALAGLSACGEKPQALHTNKSDVAAYKGTEGPFIAPGWTAGDKTSWESALKARMVNSQNEYSKMNTKK